MSADRYADFPDLLFERPAPYVLRVVLNAPERLNALTPQMHHQVARVWSIIDGDADVRVSIITGAGRGFCAGAALGGVQQSQDLDVMQRFSAEFRDASGLVQAMVESRKPVISAINGAAVGVGLAVALLSDIPIASRTAKLFDGHTRIGVAAGDHAAMIWPMLCGMAKAKYFLMTNTPMTGEEAERHNLVALAVEAEALEAKAVEVAVTLAQTSPSALAMTKYALNHWLRQARPIFDLSLALELVGFNGDESREAIAAQLEKRSPDFQNVPSF